MVHDGRDAPNSKGVRQMIAVKRERIMKAYASMTGEYGELPTALEIAEAAHVSPTYVYNVMQDAQLPYRALQQYGRKKGRLGSQGGKAGTGGELRAAVARAHPRAAYERAGRAARGCACARGRGQCGDGQDISHLPGMRTAGVDRAEDASLLATQPGGRGHLCVQGGLRRHRRAKRIIAGDIGR